MIKPTRDDIANARQVIARHVNRNGTVDNPDGLTQLIAEEIARERGRIILAVFKAKISAYRKALLPLSYNLGVVAQRLATLGAICRLK